MKYVVTIDRPYYPQVRYCDTLEEAEMIKNDLKTEHQDDGEYTVIILVARIEEYSTIKTYY